MNQKHFEWPLSLWDHIDLDVVPLTFNSWHLQSMSSWALLAHHIVSGHTVQSGGSKILVFSISEVLHSVGF